MRKNLSITKLYDKAVMLGQQNKIQEADKELDWCLVILSKNALIGMKDTDLLEGTKMGVWYERVWTLIQKLGLLPD
jgi:transposase